MRNRPNFVVIMCDDLGHDDLGLHGNKYCQTPNLDRFGEQCVRFADFSVHTSCAASRATFLTGRHFLRTGVWHDHGGKDYLHRGEITIADALKRVGYATGMWGKWQNGSIDGYLPWQRGFDDVYMAELYRHQRTLGMVQTGEQVTHTQWADQYIVDQLIRFIDEQRAAYRPFFAFISSMTPHGPLIAPLEFITRYTSQGLSENVSRLFGMIEYFDQQIGKLLNHLEQTGLTQNTVVIFLSDNGPDRNTGLLSEEDNALRNVNGLRGWKGDLWEKGVRSPLFVRFGQRYHPQLESTPCQMADIFPTVIELGGVALSDHHPKLDGQSLVPLLQNRNGYRPFYIYNYVNAGAPPTDQETSSEGIRSEYKPLPPEQKPELKYEEQVLSIRESQLKLLLNPEANRNNAERPFAEHQLMDLVLDAGEQDNLADSKAASVDRLDALLREWFEDMKNEPHSFAAPVLKLPEEKGQPRRLKAVASCDIADSLTNTAQKLKGWKIAGQYAEWLIEVAAAASFRVRFGWDVEPPDDAVFGIFVKNFGAEIPVAKQFGVWESDGLLLVERGTHCFRFQITTTKGRFPRPGELTWIEFEQPAPRPPSPQSSPEAVAHPEPDVMFKLDPEPEPKVAADPEPEPAQNQIPAPEPVPQAKRAEPAARKPQPPMVPKPESPPLQPALEEPPQIMPETSPLEAVPREEPLRKVSQEHVPDEDNRIFEEAPPLDASGVQNEKSDDEPDGIRQIRDNAPPPARRIMPSLERNPLASTSTQEESTQLPKTKLSSAYNVVRASEEGIDEEKATKLREFLGKATGHAAKGGVDLTKLRVQTPNKIPIPRPQKLD